MTILVLTEMFFMIIWDMFHERISSNLVLLRLLLNFVSGSRLEQMYTFLIVNVRLSLAHLCGFQLLLLLQKKKKTNSLVCINRINLLHLKWSSDRLVIKMVLEAVKQIYANKTKESITSQKLGSPGFWIANSS